MGARLHGQEHGSYFDALAQMEVLHGLGIARSLIAPEEQGLYSKLRESSSEDTDCILSK